MRSEADTPIEERYLWFEGKPSARAMRAIRGGEERGKPALPARQPANSEVLFVGFAYADIPLGKQFDFVFPRGTPERAEASPSVIIAATQQFGRPFAELPHGWKTICLVLFPSGIPELVRVLPVVDTWQKNEKWVCVCTTDTLEHLRAPRAPGD